MMVIRGCLTFCGSPQGAYRQYEDNHIKENV